jgi:hypothetical protein
LQRGTT